MNGYEITLNSGTFPFTVILLDDFKQTLFRLPKARLPCSFCIRKYWNDVPKFVSQFTFSEQKKMSEWSNAKKWTTKPNDLSFKIRIINTKMMMQQTHPLNKSTSTWWKPKWNICTKHKKNIIQAQELREARNWLAMNLIIFTFFVLMCACCYLSFCCVCVCEFA